MNEGSSDDEDDPLSAFNSSPGPSDIAWLSHAFPFAAPAGVTAEHVRQTLMSKLPGMQEARALCDIYYRHAAWMCACPTIFFAILVKSAFKYMFNIGILQ